ncbi:hypothetical protein KUCAC02_008731 [Chaenocephalus aceratus]|uniref:Uncharacterized protein n=1 Tax=Chaenocephalus aceratus TaxID=36190 RepID=A0ACB9WRR0_CHAAC|nr:hypothetical protein KUCAC02_008731 [Chaenocephalus aceratus]
MGKVPKKRSMADKVRKTKTSTEIKNNPFEVKINRKKFEILGQKSKHDVGLPGVSRSKAINKRKDTLLKEYKQKGKSSKFIDRRFGEYDTNMAPEDKILQRFAMERQRNHDKKDVYNLNEEEELTHYGQSLAEMEKFNDNVNSDDESEEKGLLSAELTASHFGGGGLLRRKTSGDQEGGEEGAPRAKSRQELIEELIQKSKQEKRDRQVQKEESQELTEKLDHDWKNIQALMLEQYDMMVRELVFEMKAQPSERLKTPEEADRLRRMMGDQVVESSQSQTHMSADDLNDGFILDKDDQKTLSYQSEQESEEEETQQEEEETSAQPSLSKEELKAQQEAAKAELPYTFTAPESLSDLKDLLQGHTPDNQRIIVARTQKSNHASLAVGNKLKLQKLLGFLLEYVEDLATRSPPELTTIDKLIPEFTEEVLEVKGHLPFPTLDMIVYLKLTALLFPTSDFRHPVTTPALLYISQALTKCPVRSLQDMTSGLVLCCLAVEYVSFSKRFLPELINFLAGTLHLAVQDKTSLGYIVVPPFRPSGKCSDLLVVSDSESCKSWSQKSLPLSAAQLLELKNNLDKDHHRLTCLSTCLDLPAQALPDPLKELHSEILEIISGVPAAHSRLILEKKKPIPLKLLTPKIVEILDYGKKRGSNREERERERLKHKYKKEFKGALREIRKDTRFLAREKLNEVMDRDSERKKKVRELFGSLATQEGEWKALKRRKNK